MRDRELIEVVKRIWERLDILFYLVVVFVVLYFYFIILVAPRAASAAEEDSRHQLCAEGKLPILKGFENPSKLKIYSRGEIVYLLDRPFYAETQNGGGCVLKGTPVSAHLFSAFAGHLAVRGYYDVFNHIPLPVAMIKVPEEEKKEANLFLTREELEKVVAVAVKKERQRYLQSDDELLGWNKDNWRKVAYCAGCVVIGYGVKSGKREFIGGGVVVVGVTVYYDSDKLIADQVSLADVGMGAVCGTAGYLLAPKKEEPPPPSSSGSGNTGGGSGSGPGPNPKL